MVTDGTGSPIEGIEVIVYDEDFEPEATVVTLSDGSYEVGDLYRGRYSVEFRDPAGVYPGEAYDDVASLDLATPVMVDDATVFGIDAVLDGSGSGPGGGGIRGVVVDATTGQPIEGIRVRCVDEFYSLVPECTTHTTADGSYRLAGFLADGEYFVGFSAPNGGWADEWYDDVIRVQSATPVTVVEGAWSDGVDAALEPAGAISGTVTNAGGSAFSLLTVTAYRWDGGGWAPYKTDLGAYETDYEIGGLPGGAYRVKFRGGSIFNPSFGIEEYYDDAASLVEATDVDVTVGVTTAGIDAVLESTGPGAIVNPSFDDGLDGWSNESSSGTSVHHGGIDVAGSALSGSVEVVSVGGVSTASVDQCVAIDGGSGLRFGAWSRASGASAGSPDASVLLEFFADAECSGGVIGTARSGVVIGAHDWLPVSGVASAPSGTVATRLALTLQSSAGVAFIAHWDEAFVDGDADVVFADGFETGAAQGWSAVSP